MCLSRDYVNCVAFKPDNPNIVVSASDDKTIKTWDITSGSCLSTLKVDYAVHCLTYAPNGDVLAVGDRGGNINFFNSQGEKLQSPVNVGYAFSRCSTRISLPARPLFSRFSTRISEQISFL